MAHIKQLWGERMRRLKAAWRVGWRVALCAFLLAWIFQSIFLSEGRTAAAAAGLDWDQLARLEQWRIAWTSGPRELWHTLRLVHPLALAASLLCMIGDNPAGRGPLAPGAQGAGPAICRGAAPPASPSSPNSSTPSSSGPPAATSSRPSTPRAKRTTKKPRRWSRFLWTGCSACGPCSCSPR